MWSRFLSPWIKAEHRHVLYDCGFWVGLIDRTADLPIGSALPHYVLWDRDFHAVDKVQLTAGLFFLCLKFLVAALSQQVVSHTTDNDHAISEVNDADFGARVLNTCWPDSCLPFRLHKSPPEKL